MVRHVISRPDGVAIDPGDDRFEALSNAVIDVKGNAFQAALGFPKHITTGTKCVASTASNDNHADVTVRFGVFQRCIHFAQCYVSKGIIGFWTIDGNPGNAIGFMIDDIVEGQVHAGVLSGLIGPYPDGDQALSAV
jgi:hypothetical protein